MAWPEVANPRYETLHTRVTTEIANWVYTQANMNGQSISRYLNDLLEREKDGHLSDLRD